MKSPTALQLSRIVVLLLLLRATAGPTASVQRVAAGMDLGGVVRTSIVTSLISLLFVVVLLVGRRRRHPWVVLTLEALIAAVLAFVPAVLWTLWFGVRGWTNAMVEGPVQPLAVAWLGVVVVLGFHQLRDPVDARSTSQSSVEAGGTFTES